MSILNFLIFVIFVPYLILILLYWYKWEKTAPYTPKSIYNRQYDLFISVIVALRNEENNVSSLIKSLEKQKYPENLFEVLLINDHSEDNTLTLLHETTRKSSINVKILSLKVNEFGKKQALRKGIQEAKGELIIQTDADCQMPEEWIGAFAQYYRDYNPALILAPINLEGERNLFSSFQIFENFALMGVTAGSAGLGKPILANGANLAYKKEVVLSLPNASRQDIYSGDDIFLIETLSRKKDCSIHFLKSKQAAINTQTAHTFRTFWHQRKRWIEKGKHYKSMNLLLHSIAIFSGNFIIPLTLINAILTACWWPFIAIFGMKICLDATFVISVSSFTETEKPVLHILASLLLYPFYTLVLAIGMNFGKIVWKNRNIRQKIK